MVHTAGTTHPPASSTPYAERRVGNQVRTRGIGSEDAVAQRSAGTGARFAAELPQSDDDIPLVAALRAGEEDAFVRLLDRYHGALVRLALVYVADRAVAEEVAQETWIGVLQGIERFEGRAAFKTWLFAILVNQARRRGERERRTIPFSALTVRDDATPAVPPDRFRPLGDEWAGWWASYPRRWSDTPEEILLSGEIRSLVEEAVLTLAPVQQQVVVLRDIEGWSADEVCGVLGVSAANQRVLLHRGRSKVRQALAHYLERS